MKKFNLPGFGIVCGHCNAALGKVTRRTTTPGFVIRERVCSKCRAVNMTHERVVESVRGPGRFTETHK